MKYVKDAFAYAHRAMATLTNANLMEEITDPFESERKENARGFRRGYLLAHLRSLRANGRIRANEQRCAARQSVNVKATTVSRSSAVARPREWGLLFEPS